MAQKRMTYNLRYIRLDYTYTVQEVADLLAICPHTILRWIKEGLPILPNSRPYLIFSGDLRAFLEKRQAKAKRPCKADELYCLKCRVPRKAKQGSLKVKPSPNRPLRAKGICCACATVINKVIKRSDWGKTHPLYAYTQPASKQHNGGRISQPKCSVQEGGQL